MFINQSAWNQFWHILTCHLDLEISVLLLVLMKSTVLTVESVDCLHQPGSMTDYPPVIRRDSENPLFMWFSIASFYHQMVLYNGSFDITDPRNSVPASFQTWVRWPKETLPCERDPQKQKQPRWPWRPWWSKKLRCETHVHVISCQQYSILTGTSSNIKQITTISAHVFFGASAPSGPSVQFEGTQPSRNYCCPSVRSLAPSCRNLLGWTPTVPWDEFWDELESEMTTEMGIKKVRDLSWYNWYILIILDHYWFIFWIILIYLDLSWLILEMMVSYSRNMGAWTLCDGPYPRSFGRREPAPEPLFRRASRWRFGILFSPSPFAGEFSRVCALENLHMVSYSHIVNIVIRIVCRHIGVLYALFIVLVVNVAVKDARDPRICSKMPDSLDEWVFWPRSCLVHHNTTTPVSIFGGTIGWRERFISTYRKTTFRWWKWWSQVHPLLQSSHRSLPIFTGKRLPSGNLT